MNEDMKHGKKVSIIHTTVFFFICLFFTGVAVEWELRQRRKFRTMIDSRLFTADELEAVINDFDDLKSCRDPYVEHFTQRHPEFSGLNRMWLINSCGYWLGKFRKELMKKCR